MPGGRALEVVEVDPRRRSGRGAFTALPFVLAAAHPPWRPGMRRLHEELLHPGRNPFWEGRRGSFFLARREGRTVGRMAVVDPGQLAGASDAAVLAFPDFVDDPGVVAALVDAVERRARERGARSLVGPLNPDLHHDVGIQVLGHERRNAAFMGYQPAYYAPHLEGMGFEGLADFEAWELRRDTFQDDGRLRRLAERVERSPSLVIRPLRVHRFEEELAIFHRLYAGAFAGHWGFQAPTWAEFRFLAADLRHVLRPRLGLVAEWEGEPVGFVLGVPDLHQILPRTSHGRMTPSVLARMAWRWSSMDEVRVMLAGVLPEHRARGIHLALFHRIAREIFDMGYAGGEISWVLGDNEAMARVLPLLGARRSKVYRVYRKDLHG